MPSKYWIKVWIETLHDRKVATLPDRLWRRMMECFLLAGDAEDQGWLPTVAQMAWDLHLDESELQAELEALAEVRSDKTDKGLVQLIDGRWFVTEFAESQQNPFLGEARQEWNTLRDSLSRYVYSRDGAYCRICGVAFDLTIDHIVSLARGGTNEPQNLQVLCRSCNSKKGTTCPGQD